MWNNTLGMFHGKKINARKVDSLNSIKTTNYSHCIVRHHRYSLSLYPMIKNQINEDKGDAARIIPNTTEMCEK